MYRSGLEHFMFSLLLHVYFSVSLVVWRFFFHILCVPLLNALASTEDPRCVCRWVFLGRLCTPNRMSAKCQDIPSHRLDGIISPPLHETHLSRIDIPFELSSSYSSYSYNSCNRSSHDITSNCRGGSHVAK